MKKGGTLRHPLGVADVAVSSAKSLWTLNLTRTAVDTVQSLFQSLSKVKPHSSQITTKCNFEKIPCRVQNGFIIIKGHFTLCGKPNCFWIHVSSLGFEVWFKLGKSFRFVKHYDKRLYVLFWSLHCDINIFVERVRFLCFH